MADDPSPAAEAKAVIDDRDRFHTARAGALAFGRAASILKRGGEECGRGPECDAYFTAAAAAQVIGLKLVNCLLPDVFDARNAMSAYLAEVDRGRDPNVPPVPDCT